MCRQLQRSSCSLWSKREIYRLISKGGNGSHNTACPRAALQKSTVDVHPRLGRHPDRNCRDRPFKIGRSRWLKGWTSLVDAGDLLFHPPLSSHERRRFAELLWPPNCYVDFQCVTFAGAHNQISSILRLGWLSPRCYL